MRKVLILLFLVVSLTAGFSLACDFSIIRDETFRGTREVVIKCSGSSYKVGTSYILQNMSGRWYYGSTSFATLQQAAGRVCGCN